MNISRTVLLFVFLGFFNSISRGQKLPIPINFSFYNEATAIPFTRFFTRPIHPGFQVGSEINYSRKDKKRWFQTANLNYFYHRHLAHGIGLNSELGYEYRSRLGICFSGLLGVGYLRTYTTAEEYTLIDGQYQKKSDKGNSRFYPSLSLDLGYCLKPAKSDSPKLFLRYQSWLEYPFSPGFIPVMTHINLHLGFKVFINRQ